MKRIFTISIMLSIGLAMFAQGERVKISKSIQNMCIKHIPARNVDQALINGTTGIESNTLKIGDWAEETLGETVFDLQSNFAMQHRIFLFPDHTISAVWTRGMAQTSFPDRGTGYNHFDGTSWLEFPTERIETMRCGWPSLAPYGTDGEIIVSHTANTNGLAINTTTLRGAGEWEQQLFIGPASHEKIEFPRMVTNGPDRTTLHTIYITAPENLGGSTYMGIDGALLYSRSPDGGTTWDISHEQLDGITSSEFNFVSGDAYSMAEPRGETLAFVMGSKWSDLFIMKSENNGDDWEKTVVFEHPYPLFDFDVTITDTFFTADSYNSIIIDNEGMVHIVFGITRVVHDETGDTYTGFPLYDGIGYWNESMPPFESNDPLNTMNPDNLLEDVNLIGWTQDINGNDSIEIIGGDGSLGNYRSGFSSMPQLVVDENDYLYLLFSSVTETYQTATQNYRHLWMRVSEDNGQTWNDEFFDLNGDIAFLFSECVLPSMSATSDDYLHIIYQHDDEPGLAVNGDEDPYGNNTMPYIKVHKPELLGIKQASSDANDYKIVSQNYPNPAKEFTNINIHLINPAYLTVDVYDMTGKQVMFIDQGMTNLGVHKIELNVTDLSSGIYFYRVTAGMQSETHKMLIE